MYPVFAFFPSENFFAEPQMLMRNLILMFSYTVPVLYYCQTENPVDQFFGWLLAIYIQLWFIRICWQFAKEDYAVLRQEACDIQEYSKAKLDRVTQYLGAIADKTRKVGEWSFTLIDFSLVIWVSMG